MDIISTDWTYIWSYFGDVQRITCHLNNCNLLCFSTFEKLHCALLLNSLGLSAYQSDLNVLALAPCGAANYYHLHTRDWIILHLLILVIYWSIPMPSRSVFKNFKRLTRKSRVHYFHSVVCVKTRLFNTVYRKFYIIIYFIKRDADTSTWNWLYDWWLIEWLINHTIDYSGYD